MQNESICGAAYPLSTARTGDDVTVVRLEGGESFKARPFFRSMKHGSCLAKAWYRRFSYTEE